MIPVILFSQKNTEKLRTFIGNGVHHNFSVGIDYSEGNEEFVKLTGGYRMDYKTDNFHSFIVGNAEYKKGSEKLITNKGFAHLRFIYTNHLYFQPEIFIQKEFDEFLLLKDRDLAGLGLRFSIADIAETDSFPKFDFDIGIGGMYEYEKYNSGIENFSRLIRATNYVSIFLFVNQTFSVSLAAYYQPAFSDFSDYRALGELYMNFTIFKNFKFFVSTNYRYDNQPGPGLKYYTLSITNGFSFTL